MQDIEFKAAEIDSLSTLLVDEKNVHRERIETLNSRHDEERNNLREQLETKESEYQQSQRDLQAQEQLNGEKSVQMEVFKAEKQQELDKINEEKNQ